jgi:UDP-MurNAc hydroxylase
MIIKLYRSATVGLKSGNYKLLMDPWLVDGEYFGSWSHFPKYNINENLNEINSYNGIYISHIHPDHCSDKTLKLINKNIPIYIHSFHSKFLKFKLERMGFNVFEIKNGSTIKLSSELSITIYAADNCNPELCYKFSGCADLEASEGSQQIDTIAVFEDSNNVIVNTNDCPYELAEDTLKRIKRKYDKIDLLLTGYQNASPYPQCFENLDTKEKINEGKKVAQSCLNRGLSSINLLKPEYFLPFAGTYILTGNLSKIDYLRGVPSIDDAFKYLSKNQSISKPLMLSTDSEFNFNSKLYSKKYQKFDVKKYNEYLEFLSSKKLDFENGEYPDLDDIYDLSKSAHIKYLEKKLSFNIKFDTDIYIEIYDKLIKLCKNDKIQLEESSNNLSEKFIVYKVDSRLLKLLLKGPRYAHWNNAEIGSHLKFFRKPNIFERQVHGSMNYFHN